MWASVAAQCRSAGVLGHTASPCKFTFQSSACPTCGAQSGQVSNTVAIAAPSAVQLEAVATAIRDGVWAASGTRTSSGGIPPWARIEWTACAAGSGCTSPAPVGAPSAADAFWLQATCAEFPSGTDCAALAEVFTTAQAAHAALANMTLACSACTSTSTSNSSALTVLVTGPCGAAACCQAVVDALCAAGFPFAPSQSTASCLCPGVPTTGNSSGLTCACTPSTETGTTSNKGLLGLLALLLLVPILIVCVIAAVIVTKAYRRRKERRGQESWYDQTYAIPGDGDANAAGHPLPTVDAGFAAEGLSYSASREPEFDRVGGVFGSRVPSGPAFMPPAHMDGAPVDTTGPLPAAAPTAGAPLEEPDTPPPPPVEGDGFVFSP